MQSSRVRRLLSLGPRNVAVGSLLLGSLLLSSFALGNVMLGGGVDNDAVGSGASPTAFAEDAPSRVVIRVAIDNAALALNPGMLATTLREAPPLFPGATTPRLTRWKLLEVEALHAAQDVAALR